MEKRLIAKIAVSAAIFSIDKPYSYLIPEPLSERVLPGIRVTVPFGRGNRRCEGIVLSVSEESESVQLKSIESLLDETPVLTAEQIKLALWMRERFFCTLYEAVRTLLPTGMWFRDGVRNVSDKVVKYAYLSIPAEEALQLSQDKKLRAPQQAAILQLMSAVGEGMVSEILQFTGAPLNSLNALVKQGSITVESKEVYRRPKVLARNESASIELTPSQKTVFDGLSKLLHKEESRAALLFGVTGSGKTSVYIHLVKDALKIGKSAIVLVPEIGLTPQFVGIFSSHFGDSVAVLHSSLSTGERYDEWKRIRSGNVKVVIGTRSAVFAPVSDLGLIIIDEEQEHTYKSENSPRYHARDIAKYRCVQSKALLLLGSATPSVNSMHSAKEGKYAFFTLESRYNERPLPSVLIADMRRELKCGNGGSISSVLREELQKNIDAGEQSILFINRRGAANLVVCGECGHTFSCPNCSVSMTYHSVGKRLLCHYCGHSEAILDFCPQCGGKLKFVGAGTQKVEEELKELFPDIQTLRMDTDTVSRVGSHEEILAKFREEKIPILIGTQMVTKGLDFENVTLVGVISADQSLYAGDYRAHERTFDLITQVVGRSGRGVRPGRAVIQTFTPENEVILLAAKQDYPGFYEREILLRQIMEAPPISDLFSMTVSGQDKSDVLRGCVKLRDSLENYFSGTLKATVLGPVPTSVERVNNRFRYRLLVSCKNTKDVRSIIAHVMREFYSDKTNRRLSLITDADPLD